MKKLYLIVLLVLAGQYAFAGYTKGYYDRLLSSSKATKIGVGYDFQFLDEDIPAEEFCRPAIIFNIVDFPAPFFPTRAILSRRLIT